jgi:hypothetical protein
MKKLILCLVILFAVPTLTAGKEGRNSSDFSEKYSAAAKTSANRSNFPKIFRKIKRGLRRMVGLPPVPVCILVNNPANVTGLSLNREEIIVRQGGEESSKIDIFTEYSDPENDVVTYYYEITAGKIVGQGARVTWDLRGVAPGTYTITAGVNDGCGICGQTKTVRIEILEGDIYPLRETE